MLPHLCQKSLFFTYFHSPETIEIHGCITWPANTAGTTSLPDSAVIRLYANSIEFSSKRISALDDWLFSFPDLPRYSDGKEILYTVSTDDPAAAISCF